MLSCDYCQDWFHYDCVGLRAPSDDEDDEDVAPEDYRCPNCCTKASAPQGSIFDNEFLTFLMQPDTLAP